MPFPSAQVASIETAFVLGTTRREYTVLKMWEQYPAMFLDDPALLPLATLAAAPSPTQLLEQVAQQVSTIESTQQRQEISAYSQLLAGLRFDKRLIRQIFQEGIMRESVIYQEILQEGELKGEIKGRQEGMDAGKLEEAQALILRQLTRRIGTVAPAMQTQIQSLSLTQLENLGEALLDFSSPTDLLDWLQNH